MIARFSLARLIRTPSRERDLPVLRRADSHPDAPARRPIRASEEFGRALPMESLSVVATPRPAAKPEGLALPVDLETPLAAFDPAAIPTVPREPVRAVKSLASRPQIIDPGERFETFELTPIVRETPARLVSRSHRPALRVMEQPASIGALLDRLERTATRNIRPHPSIEETLGMLRKLATQ